MRLTIFLRLSEVMQIKTFTMAGILAYDQGEPGVTLMKMIVLSEVSDGSGTAFWSSPCKCGGIPHPVLCVLSASGPVLVPQSPNPGVTV